MSEKSYLGDGLYASFNGYYIILECDRENGRNWVALEDTAINSFLKYIEKIYDVKIEKRSTEEE